MLVFVIEGPQNELEERLKQQQAEANRKEKVLLMQLTRKEQDLQEVAVSSILVITCFTCVDHWCFFVGLFVYTNDSLGNYGENTIIFQI